MKVSTGGATAVLAAALTMGLISPQTGQAQSLEDILGKAIIEGIEEGLKDAIDGDSKPSTGKGGYGLPTVQSSWRVGDRVLGQWSNGKWYPARINGVRSNGYHLLFDDGDTSVANSNQIATFSWQRGVRVECKRDGSYTPGMIGGIENGNVYVYFDDGPHAWSPVNTCRHEGTPPNAGLRMVRKNPAAPPAPANVQTAPPVIVQQQEAMNRPGYFSAGSWALGYWSGHWYPGTVITAQGSSYSFKFDAGGSVVKLTGNQISKLGWTPGTLVQCNWKRAGTWYDARIMAMTGKNARVSYLSGNQENLPTGYCRSARP